MARILDKYEYKIPEHLVCAIEYGQNDDLTDDELDELSQFLANLPEGNGHWAWGTESYFSHTNDVMFLGCTVVDATYVIMESASQREA